jgi:hypothetical protein
MPAVTARPKKKRPAITKKTILVIAMSSLVVLTVAGIGTAAFLFLPLGFGYRSPQAVWEAQKKALADRDWKTLYNTMTPETQDQVVGGLAFMVSMAGTVDARLTEIRKTHGIEDTSAPSNPSGFADALQKMQSDMSAAATTIKDKPGFFRDVMDYFQEKGDEFNKQLGTAEVRKAMEAATLKDVVIEGDSARGTQSIQVMGGTLSLPVAFRKVGGGWRIHSAFGSGVRPAAASPGP